MASSGCGLQNLEVLATTLRKGSGRTQSTARSARSLALMAALLTITAALLAYGKEPGERQLKVLRRQVTVGADGGSAEKKVATAVVAAGCFWGVELAYSRLPGVITTEVGYTGGKIANPTYQAVSRGDTMHAEAVRVTYDANVVSLADLLDVFFDAHDPTTLNRQGGDVGTQYRSAIFFANEEERAIAEEAIEKERNRRSRRSIATTIEPLGAWTPAEEYHRELRLFSRLFLCSVAYTIVCAFSLRFWQRHTWQGEARATRKGPRCRLGATDDLFFNSA